MSKHIKGFFKWLKISYRDLREWLLDWIRFYKFIIQYFLIYIVISFFCSLDYRVVAFIFLSFIILTIILFLIYIFNEVKNEDKNIKETLNSATSNLDEFNNYLKKFDNKNIDNLKNKNNDNLDLDNLDLDDSEIINSSNNLNIRDWEIEIDIIDIMDENNEEEIDSFNIFRYINGNASLEDLERIEIFRNKQKNLNEDDLETPDSSTSKNKDDNFKI